MGHEVNGKRKITLVPFDSSESTLDEIGTVPPKQQSDNIQKQTNKNRETTSRAHDIKTLEAEGREEMRDTL